jgi:hypothetical protein
MPPNSPDQLTPPAVEAASQPISLPQANGSDQPVPVVKVLSVRGVEYGMMSITLWVGAITLGWVLLNIINGSRGFDYLVVPTAALIVCVPLFGLLFIRLKKAELSNPSLRLEPSKRRWSQITQFLSYLACLINLIYFVYVVLQHAADESATPIGKAALNLGVVLAIAGGILAYYWFDEHRIVKG